jgi:hypothetical protein
MRFPSICFRIFSCPGPDSDYKITFNLKILHVARIFTEIFECLSYSLPSPDGSTGIDGMDMQ